jgi:hypothetical protein
MEHLRHSHAIHMPHPVHWLQNHPMAMALLLTAAIALIVIGTASLIQTGIRMDTFERLRFDYIYPFSPMHW